VFFYALSNRQRRSPGQSLWAPARERFTAQEVDAASSLGPILSIFALLPVFWALFDQHASTWVEQARQLDRTLSVPLWSGRTVLVATVVLALFGGARLLVWVMNRPFPRAAQSALLAVLGLSAAAAIAIDVTRGEWLTLELKAAQLQALNPLMVMMIIPLMNWAVYRPLERRSIQTGTVLEGRRVVHAGLAAGEQVVSTRLQMLQPGMAVEPVVEAPKPEAPKVQ
jgi:dipeptide/tripeptide permease